MQWLWYRPLGIVGGLLWLAAAVYVLVLATRFVRAVERIAQTLEDRKP